MMFNVTYLMSVVMKYEEFFVYKNVIMSIYKKNNTMNFESFYQKMMIKNTKHVDGFDYACHLVKVSANVIWQRQTKNQNFVIRLNTKYDTASIDV